MPRTCTICRHDKRSEIDKALLDERPFRAIARQYGPSRGALARHQKSHIIQSLALSKKAEDELAADDLFGRLQYLSQQTLDILESAKHDGSPNVALSAIKRLESQIELRARLAGQLNGTKAPNQTQVNVYGSAEFNLAELSDEQLLARVQILGRRLEQSRADHAESVSRS